MRIDLDDTLARLGGQTPPPPPTLSATALFDALPPRRRRTALVLGLVAAVLAGALLLGWAVTRPVPAPQPSPTPTPTSIETVDVTSYTWQPGQGVDPSKVTLAPSEVARRCHLKTGEHVHPSSDVALGSTVSVYPRGAKVDPGSTSVPKGTRECEVGYQEVPVATPPTEVELNTGDDPDIADSCRRHTGFAFDDPAWHLLGHRVSTSVFGQILAVAYRSPDGWLAQCLLVHGGYGMASFISLTQDDDEQSQGQENCPVLQALPVVTGTGTKARVTSAVFSQAVPVWRVDGQSLERRVATLRLQPEGSRTHVDFPATDGVALAMGEVAIDPPGRVEQDSLLSQKIAVTVLDAQGHTLRRCTSG